MPSARVAAGIEFPDQEIAGELRAGLARVEELLVASCNSPDLLLNDTASHLATAGGKRFRPLLVLLASQFGDHPRAEIDKAAVVVELTHLATLYHDDVMDEAELRRGAVSVNARWGNSVAILSGDFLFAKASALVAELGNEAVRIQAETFQRLVTGQIRETTGPRLDDGPVEHYLEVLAEKTGSLIATSGRFGAMFAGCDDEVINALTQYGEAIGMAFQLSDDLIDITSDSAELGKATGTDLREGIRTLPMLYALADPDTDPTLLKLLSGPIPEDDKHAEALKLLRESAAMERARATLTAEVDRARTCVAALPEGSARDSLVALVEYMQLRSR